MNIRKNIDYSEVFNTLDKALTADLPQIKLCCEIGRLICTRVEKGTAVAVAAYIAEHYPETTGFSPRNLRRMRDFYKLYAECSDLMAQAMQIGWTQNAVILESDLTMEERGWYLQAVAQHGWSKIQLQKQICVAAHLQTAIDKDSNICYTVQRQNGIVCAVAEETPATELVIFFSGIASDVTFHASAKVRCEAAGVVTVSPIHPYPPCPAKSLCADTERSHFMKLFDKNPPTDTFSVTDFSCCCEGDRKSVV